MLRSVQTKVMRSFGLSLSRLYQRPIATVAIETNPNEEYKDNSETHNNMNIVDANFEAEFNKNRIEMSVLQKFILSTGSSIAALLDPKRHDMIACLAETTSEVALQKILDEMLASEEGTRILKQKPRINTSTVDMAYLANLPENTLGYNYHKFLVDNNVTPDSRLCVRFMDDVELAYVMTRYRECHDLVHTILGMPTNMLGEVAVKWVEALNTHLPMCYSGAVLGAMRLKSKQRKEYLRRYLPWARQTGQVVKPLLNVYWEERWEQDITDLRNHLGIKLMK